MLLILWKIVVFQVIIYRVESQFSVCGLEYCLTTNGRLRDVRSLQHAQSMCPADSWLIEMTSGEVFHSTLNLLYQYDLIDNSFLLNAERANNSWIWIDKKEARVSIRNTDDTNIKTVAYLYRDSSGSLVFEADKYITNRDYICSKTVTIEECDKLGGWFHSDTGECFFAKNSFWRSWPAAEFQCSYFFNANLAIFNEVDMTSLPGSFIAAFFSLNESYWIGLSKNTWTWSSSGAVIAYNRWRDYEPPVNGCVMVNGRNFNFEWQNTDCSGSFMIICMSTASTESKPTEQYNGLMVSGWVVAGCAFLVTIVMALIFLIRSLNCPTSFEAKRSDQNKTGQYDQHMPCDVIINNFTNDSNFVLNRIELESTSSYETF